MAPQKVELLCPFKAKDRHVSLWGKDQAALLPRVKGSGLLNSGFLSCKASRCLHRCHRALFERS